MLKKDEAEFDKVQKIYLEMKGGADPMQQPQQMMLEPQDMMEPLLQP
jgi:hypothetical protein